MTAIGKDGSVVEAIDLRRLITPIPGDPLRPSCTVIGQTLNVIVGAPNSANITAKQQRAEMGLLVCNPVIKRHGKHLDPAVWSLTTAAGFPRSRWGQVTARRIESPVSIQQPYRRPRAEVRHGGRVMAAYGIPTNSWRLSGEIRS
jgi:hypothetical protein